MNKHHLEKTLCDTSETRVTVSDRLHQDIMRSVRLAVPVAAKTGFGWAIPAWGAALAIMAMTVFQFTRINTPEPPTLVQAERAVPGEALMALSDRLLMISEDSLLPEKELKLELERLKSDLQRLGFRS